VARVRKIDKKRRYWIARQFDPEIMLKKHREFLLDKEYKREKVDATLFTFAFRKTKADFPNLNITTENLVYLLYVEQFFFYTRKHLDDLNIYLAPNAAKRITDKCMAQFLVEPRMNNWDLDDAEYKQMFGEDTNRHQYRVRYAITQLGKSVCDKFYENIL